MLRVGLMCAGLVLASLFLWIDKLSGAEWVAICSVLFSVDRVGNAITDGFEARRG